MPDDNEDLPVADGPYKPGNTDENGDYITGKFRPPDGSKFRVNDGRARGRRPKGKKNRKTEFLEQINERITMVENGRKKRVTKRRAADAQMIDGAIKGKAASQRMYYAQLEKILGDDDIERPVLSPVQQAILEDFQRRFDSGFEGYAPPPQADEPGAET
jgi:hypothetical protein